MRPPPFARRLLSRALPHDHRRVVIGDLDEEFARYISPSRSRLAAWFWYWRQAIGSLPAARRMRRRHQAASGTTAPDAIRRVLRETAADLHYALRLLWHHRGFSAAAVATLALGIAGVSAVSTVTDAVLLRALPYADADRIASVREIDTRRQTGSGNLSYPDFLDYRAANTTFEALAAYSGGSRTLSGAGAADRLVMTEVTDGFFDVLGVRPALGRDFEPADSRPNAQPVVILTDGAWRRRFGADPGILGRSLTLSGIPTTVVGVLPRGFHFPPRGLTELWLPVRPSPQQVERRYWHWLDAIGRLRDRVTVEAAAADLDVIARRFATIDPRWHPAARSSVVPLRDRLVGPIRPTLMVLTGAAAFLLLAACASIAGLLVARGAARAHEMTVRAALGARASRLVRQLLAECLVLAIPGAALGIAVGHWAVRLFMATMPEHQRMALPNVTDVSLDPRVAGFSAALSIAVVLAFGLAPAWQAARRAITSTLRERLRVGSTSSRLQSVFVSVQLALALVLLAGTGLMARSVYQLLSTSPGFETDNLLTFRTALPWTRLPDAAAVRAFHASMLDAFAAVPGVKSLATINQLPLTGRNNTGGFAIHDSPDRPDQPTLVRTVSANYFDVMGIPLREGRLFGPADRAGAPHVIVINETLARTVFEGRAIGRRIAFPFFDGRPWWEIIGVVADEQFDALDRDMAPVAYFSFAQTSDSGFSFVVRTSVEPGSLVADLRSALARLDTTLPLFAAYTIDDITAQSDAVYRRRAVLLLMGGFAAAALLLAVVGVSAMLAQTVSQRTREIGVRMALGATSSAVFGSILRRSLVLAAGGLASGLAATVAAATSLQGLLYRVAPRDPAMLASSLGLLIAVILVASIVPAVRAMRIDPVDALRGE